MNFLSPLLGHDMRLASVTAVASFPGAECSISIAIISSCFASFPISARALPLYAVNVSMPLIDIDAVTGPTAIWPGSHRWPEHQEAKPTAWPAFPFSAATPS